MLNFKKVWTDPVWSKVIAGIILGILGVVAGIISKNWDAARKYLSYPIGAWLVVVFCAIAFVVGILVLRRVISGKDEGGPYRFTSQLKCMSVSVSDPNPELNLIFPLKVFWTFRNDSIGCIDVSFDDYKPLNVTCQSLPMAVLQIQMNQKWLPSDFGVSEIAVRPRQLFKGWIPVDPSLYSATQVRGHIGKLGTIVLKVNGQLQQFDL